MTQSLTWYVVDTHELSDDERAEACRVVLESLRGVLVRGECDLPWSAAASWSRDVLEAAGRLRDRFVPETGRDPHYQQTGVQDLRDPDVWADFVTFVPEAYDAGFWSDRGFEVSLSDCAGCIAVLADAALLAELTERLEPFRLAPAATPFLERAAARLRHLLRRVRRDRADS